MAKPLKFKKREIDYKKTKEQRELEITRDMTDLYRQNPHRFISTELGCTTLTWFQDVTVYLACRSSIFRFIATRGIGKSFIVGWIVIVLAILYPRIKIVLASSTREQARLLVKEKILREIYNRYPNVQKEIDMDKSSTSANDTYITFRNGSQIVCVTSSENSRGNRCAILVCEESVKMEQNIKENVLAKFLQNGERIPRYKDNPKYAGFKPTDEKKKQIHITSGEFQTNPVYKECIDTFKHMLKHKDISQVLLSMHWGFPVAEPFINMTYEEDIKTQMESSTFSRLFWTQENEGLFVSESQYSMFSYQELKKLRTIEKTFLAIPHYLYTDEKDLRDWNKRYAVPKEVNELRVLAIDVAMMGGKNDNTVFSVTSAIPDKDGKRYNRKLMFMEHASDTHSEVQSIRMKQLYYDYDVDVICLDCNGNGMGVADAASKSQHDESRSIDYPAFTVFNREDMVDRKYNAEKEDVVACIFAIKQDAKFNHDMITYLKNVVETGRLELPVDSNDARAFYEDENEKNKDNAKARISDMVVNEYLKVNIEVDYLVKELMALEVKKQTNSPYLKVENNLMRKDRFSSIGFANYWISKQETGIELNKDGYDPTDEDWYFEV